MFTAKLKQRDLSLQEMYAKYTLAASTCLQQLCHRCLLLSLCRNNPQQTIDVGEPNHSYLEFHLTLKSKSIARVLHGLVQCHSISNLCRCMYESICILTLFSPNQIWKAIPSKGCAACRFLNEHLSTTSIHNQLGAAELTRGFKSLTSSDCMSLCMSNNCTETHISMLAEAEIRFRFEMFYFPSS